MSVLLMACGKGPFMTSYCHSAVHFFCDDWRLELCTSWILLTIIIMTKIGKRKGSIRYDLGSPERTTHKTLNVEWSGKLKSMSVSHPVVYIGSSQRPNTWSNYAYSHVRLPFKWVFTAILQLFPSNVSENWHEIMCHYGIYQKWQSL